MLRVDFCSKSSGAAAVEKYRRRFRTQTQFLTALWDHLERASETAIRHDVTEHLDQVLEHCEAAVSAIRRWKAAPAPPPIKRSGR
ncbi:MAG: hypothetical protein JWM33_881 [Caulobacteraceae bacterium]|nr:hypothetical protein [Caulobacteraceae bacterium]